MCVITNHRVKYFADPSKAYFLHRNFTPLFCSRNTARKPQLLHVTLYLTHGLSKRNIYFLTFFRCSSLFLLYIFSKSINHFPDLYIDSIRLPLQ